MSIVRIAILEGDPVIATGKKMLLESQSDFLVVYESEFALQAVTELPQQLVDVIVLDMRLRGKDGVEAAKLLSAAYAAAGEKVPRMILTTAYSAPEIQQIASAVGVGHVIAANELGRRLIEAVRG